MIDDLLGTTTTEFRALQLSQKGRADAFWRQPFGPPPFRRAGRVGMSDRGISNDRRRSLYAQEWLQADSQNDWHISTLRIPHD